MLPVYPQSPYLLPWMNHLWTGLWTALVYTTGIQLVMHYYSPAEPWNLEIPSPLLAYRTQMTWAVLYGIFPAVLLGEPRICLQHILIHAPCTRQYQLCLQVHQQASLPMICCSCRGLAEAHLQSWLPSAAAKDAAAAAACRHGHQLAGAEVEKQAPQAV
jgi:hypothetical protein